MRGQGKIEKAIQEVFAEWMRPVSHADVILNVQPVWASAKTMRALTGLSREKLNALVSERKVIAKMAGKNVVYRVADVLAAIEEFPNKGMRVADNAEDSRGEEDGGERK